MIAFGACAGTVRHSAPVCNSSRVRVRVCMDTCAFALVIGRSPICAAGDRWTSRTTSAPWAARNYHTTVIDAAGAIYVIGGTGSGTFYNDVWVSTDKGAVRTRGILDWYLRIHEGTFVVLREYSGSTQGYYRGVEGGLSCTKGTQWVLWGTPGVLLGYSVGTYGILQVLKRRYGGTQRVSLGYSGLLKGFSKTLKRTCTRTRTQSHSLALSGKRDRYLRTRPRSHTNTSARAHTHARTQSGPTTYVPFCGGIYSSAATDTCAFALIIGRPPICAAGATWTSRTTSSPWAARYGHTSVIDAAGAIYVIGGSSGTTYYKDVWVSTDGGPDQTRVQGREGGGGGAGGVVGVN
jgi:hypothetical protein